jgi:hypothetical protein
MIPVVAAFSGNVPCNRNQTHYLRSDLPKNIITVLQDIFEDRLRPEGKVTNNVPFSINFLRIGWVAFIISSAEKGV